MRVRVRRRRVRVVRARGERQRGRGELRRGGAEPREGTKASPRLSCDFVVRELCEQAGEWRAAQPAPPNPE